MKNDGPKPFQTGICGVRTCDRSMYFAFWNALSYALQRLPPCAEAGVAKARARTTARRARFTPQVLPLRAEVRRVRAGRVPGAADRGVIGHADPDLAERAVEDVRPVAGAVHPHPHDHPGPAVAPAAPGQVLAHDPAVRAVQVAGAADAVEERAAAQRVV